MEPALTSADACRKLQAACAVSGDWRLRFGGVAALSEVLHRTMDDAVTAMVIKGEARGGMRRVTDHL